MSMLALISKHMPDNRISVQTSSTLRTVPVLQPQTYTSSCLYDLQMMGIDTWRPHESITRAITCSQGSVEVQKQLALSPSQHTACSGSALQRSLVLSCAKLLAAHAAFVECRDRKISSLPLDTSELCSLDPLLC